MSIIYSFEPDLAVDEFREILIASTLSSRRPVDDLARLESMLRHADVVITARDGGLIVGISRAITDFSYCCYLSDLAVKAEYQRQGIGKRLIAETRIHAGEAATLILVSAPDAESYYPKIGMKHLASCWSVPRSG